MNEVIHFTNNPETDGIAEIKISSNDNAYGVGWANLVREYLKTAYDKEEVQCEVKSFGKTYKVLKRDKVTAFYDEDGNTLFDVVNERLQKEYEYVMRNSDDREISETDRTLAQAETQKENNDAAECINGKNPNGVCGAAAYCNKGLKCCSECQEPCNSCCGWLDNATEKTNGDEVEKEKDSTEKTVDTTESGELEEDKDKTEKSISVYSGVDGAIAKLQSELEKAKEKEFAKPVIEYLLERCKQSESLAADICQSHKTWEKCYKYIYEEARKKLNSKSGPVRDDVVFEWAEDYFHLDDKALEEKKAKEEAERKKKSAEKKKQDTEKKGKTISVKSPKSGKAEENRSEVPRPQREVQKQKPKKNELDGQMDMFSMMGM